MVSDLTKVPEFASWDSFQRFARSVRLKRRYVWEADDAAFLRTVVATILDRDVTLEAGQILYRAQRGIDTSEIPGRWGGVDDEVPVGFSSERMKPRRFAATEGRANPAGIPVLYLGTTVENVIGEVRPWVGASVSVAQFKLRKAVRIIDLSRCHGKSAVREIGLMRLFDGEPITRDEKERAVWTDIDNAFSLPVTTSDDKADYAPTQILTELFRDAGYDGVIYKSHFAKQGLNLALFDIDAADPVSCAPYEVTEVKLQYRQIYNAWSVSESRPTP